MNAKTGWANIRMWRDGGDVWPARLSLDRRHVAMRADNSSGIRSMPRRLLYQLWSRLPVWVQRLVIRLAAPRVTLGVCAVILDARGRLLLAHHPYRRRGWGLPGGFARGNEQPHEALARELREELGSEAMIGPLLCAETATSSGHLTLYYRAALTGLPRPDGTEIDTCRYVPLSDVPALLDTPVPSWLRLARTALVHERGCIANAHDGTRGAYPSHSTERRIATLSSSSHAAALRSKWMEQRPYVDAAQ